MLEIATTATTPTVKSNQWLSTSPTIDSGTILAIRQPTMPCATTKGCSGGRTLPPLEANTIAGQQRPQHQRRRRMQPQQECRKAGRQRNEDRPLQASAPAASVACDDITI